jgi:rubrerythrin
LIEKRKRFCVKNKDNSISRIFAYIKDSYPNIAYLFKTFATSESIHAGLFKKALADLAVTFEAEGDRQVKVLSTKKNLRKAARHELELIKNFYPQAIKRIKTEKHENALKYFHYSWQSHKQHRSYIEDIDRWSGIFFGMVAKTIEKEDLQFVVCRFCGSTESEIPPETCPVCRQPSAHYEKITRSIDL